MLDKKEDQLIRITSFYPAKQLFILCFCFEEKENLFKEKNQISYPCGNVPIQRHCVEIFH